MLKNTDYTLPLDNFRKSMVQSTQMNIILVAYNTTFTNILIVSAIVNYRRKNEKEALIQLDESC